MFNYTLSHYQSMSNTFIYHDIYQYFRIPGYDIPIIDSQLYVFVSLSTMWCFNVSVLHNKLIDIQGNSNYIDYNKINNYYWQKINYTVSRIKNDNILFYLFQESNYFEHIFFV